MLEVNNYDCRNVKLRYLVGLIINCIYIKRYAGNSIIILLKYKNIMKISELSNSKSKNFHLDLDKNLSKPDSDSESIESELKSLQEQITSLENRSDSRNTQRVTNRRSGSIDSFLRSVDNTEKEIRKLEGRISKSPVKKNMNNNYQLLGDLKSRLVMERQNNYSMRMENEKLQKKIIFKVDLAEELTSLQDDYQTLIDSYKRSENIRKKQKKLITNLKHQLFAKNQHSKKGMKVK